MEKNELEKKVKEIKMPKEMQERIIRTCYKEMEENTMKKCFKKPMVAVATVALGLCLTGITALASTGKLEGFFKDIIRWDGAVIGTSYEQATEEVELNIVDVAQQLTVELTILHSDVAPYSLFESFGIEEYKIMDENGNIVAESREIETAFIVDGKVQVRIPLENISAGQYTLVASKLVGTSKGDQPLLLNGNWKCEFIKK